MAEAAGESLSDIFGKLKNKDSIRRQKNKSVKWLSNKIQQIDKNYIVSRPQIGGLYLSRYLDPKYKDVLPYYDQNPLIIPVDISRTGEAGFLSLNLHYLYPKHRVALLDKLNEYASESDNRKRISLSYSFLKEASNLKEFKPALKKHILSRWSMEFVEIPSDEWEYIVLLPIHKFSGASAQTVWRQSAGKY